MWHKTEAGKPRLGSLVLVAFLRGGRVSSYHLVKYETKAYGPGWYDGDQSYLEPDLWMYVPRPRVRKTCSSERRSTRTG